MALTITLVRKDVYKDNIARTYKAVMTGTYDATNGQTFDFTAATDPKKFGRARPPARVGALPANDQIEVVGEPLGFTAELKQAAASPTLLNYVLRVENITANPGAELLSAAYPAGALNNAIYVRVTTARRHG